MCHGFQSRHPKACYFAKTFCFHVISQGILILCANFSIYLGKSSFFSLVHHHMLNTKWRRQLKKQ